MLAVSGRRERRGASHPTGPRRAYGPAGAESDDLQPVVDATHRGQANFVVYLIGLGDVSGEQLVVNEIGNYSGQTLVDSMPEGTYLLEVMADGTWSVKFTP